MVKWNNFGFFFVPDYTMDSKENPWEVDTLQAKWPETESKAKSQEIVRKPVGILNPYEGLRKKKVFRNKKR